jgi:hypothetical protein
MCDSMTRDFDQAPSSSALFRHGDQQNCVVLSVEGDLLRVTFRGDPHGGALVDCFRDAIDAAALTRRLPTLVDLTAFNGRVDWNAVREVGTITPWNKDGKPGSRVAYVTDSFWFKALLKLVKELYPETQHRQFDDTSSAAAWLTARPAARS